ncbi:MAG: AAA family ATPase [Bryobacterales bacterium]|nr:AAA family ATPase [Bryobacterales bacterium]
MRVLALDIQGFRGIPSGRLVLPDQVALVGPNGSGKSTIIDALSLVFGRQKLVHNLTEHDFTGSCPQPADRIRIVATVGGFPSNDPDRNTNWFRSGRSIEKWWDPATKTVLPEEQPGTLLCAQIGYAARFDHEDLTVKQIRYFQQHDDQVDPFDEEAIDRFPDRLLSDVGFFVLPARRTWAATISFGSELFRKAVATLGGVPATTVIHHRDALRNPSSPLEEDRALQPLIQSINTRMAQLVPGNPRLHLRVTSTDSESLLQALVPHYQRDEGGSLPAGRHGTGLISLQTLVLLLEIGRARKTAGQSFILALEEPELHVPPGLQRRLIGDAAAVSDQVICTTHAPRAAAFFDAASIQILSRTSIPGDDGGSRVEKLEGRPLSPASMVNEPNSVVQLYTDHRARLVEALMFPRVLIPEGRIDFEWLRLLLDVAETGERMLHGHQSPVPPFGSVVGVVPTRDSALRATFERLRSLHDHVGVLVDGDPAGDRYVADLISCSPTPCCVMQWPTGWAIEDAVRWTLDADDPVLLAEINTRLDRQFQSLDELVAALKNTSGQTGGLKAHYMAHEDIAGAMRKSPLCVQRVERLLEAVTRAVLRRLDGFENLESDEVRSRNRIAVCRFRA